jgi:hypothetical protein
VLVPFVADGLRPEMIAALDVNYFDLKKSARGGLTDEGR